MSDRVEFDIDKLHNLVDEALREPGPDLLPSSGSGSRSIPFSVTDTKLFEYFWDALFARLPEDQVHLVLDDVRKRYLSNWHNTDLRTLHTLVKNCRACPDVEKEPCLPVGNLANPDVALVHQFPPRDGVLQSSLVSYVNEAGFSKNSIIHTSIARCDPLTVRPPSEAEVSTCSSLYLFSELQLLGPRLILPIGLEATKVFLGKIDSLTAHRGQVHWLGPFAIFPINSVAYVNRAGENAQKELVTDLKLAYEFCYKDK